MGKKSWVPSNIGDKTFMNTDINSEAGMTPMNRNINLDAPLQFQKSRQMVENIKLQMLKNVHKMQGHDSNANFEPSNRSEVQEKKHLLK